MLWSTSLALKELITDVLREHVLEEVPVVDQPVHLMMQRSHCPVSHTHVSVSHDYQWDQTQVSNRKIPCVFGLVRALEVKRDVKCW